MKTLNALLFTFCLTSLGQANADTIGSVSTPAKKLTATSAGVSRTLSMGDSFSAGDQIVIGPDERRNVQFTLTDGTLFSCAPNSTFTITSYQFQGKATDNLAATLTKGGCRILAGNIDRAGSQGQVWRTPTAVMGLAGTLVGIEVLSADTAFGLFQGNGSVLSTKGQLNLGSGLRFDFASIDARGLRGQLLEPKLFDKLEVLPVAVDESERIPVSSAIFAEHIVRKITDDELHQIKASLQRAGNFKDKSIMKLHDPQMELKAEGLFCD